MSDDVLLEGPSEDDPVKNMETPAFPSSLEELSDHIKEIGDIRRELSARDALLNQQIENLRTEHQKATEQERVRLQMLEDGVLAYAELHREELLVGRGKTAELPSGQLTWRSSSEVVIENPRTIVARLRRHRWLRCIRVKYEPDKRELKKKGDAELRRHLRGVYIQEKEAIEVKPKGLDGILLPLNDRIRKIISQNQ